MNTNLARIEEQLQITLPEFYKKTITDYPFKAKNENDFIEDNIVKDTDWLIDVNKELRIIGFMGTQWPNHFYAIGHDGCGGFMFINLQKEDTTIYYADHEEEFDVYKLDELELFESMEEFVNECNDMYNDGYND